MFKKNEGMIDRAARIVVGCLLVSIFYFFPEAPWRWVGLIGAVPIFTGILGWCPLYSIMGISTCPMKKA